MNVMHVTNYEEMSQVAAELLIRQIKEKPEAVIGFATGSTPVGLYKELIESFKKNEVSFKDITTFNLDEYIGLDAAHSQSYHYFMKHTLFDQIDVSPERIHLPSGVGDAKAEAAVYEEKIKQAGGIDLQILGIGENGHIAFNEPGTSFTSRTQQVVLTESTRNANARFFEDEKNVPTHAITMGIGTILEAKNILLLISGENKKEAFQKLVNGEVTEEFPASALKNHPNVTVIVTKDAIE